MTETTVTDANAPFEGPEKLLEIWFAASSAHVPDAAQPDENGRTGLRKVPRQTWEDMLDIVRCKVLSVVHGDDTDAYLLSESSLFISPHRLILKTCGTTLNLLGLPRILEIAAQNAAMPSVYRCFYSRKSFMFPDRQKGPHKDWKHEVEYLDNIFPNGAAYTVGRVNGDHWLLYLTNPEDSQKDCDDSPSPAPSPPPQLSSKTDANQDFTIEILMSDLAPDARHPFFSTSDGNPLEQGLALSSSIGISDIFPPEVTTLDAFSFDPCGYSANAIIRGTQEGPSSSFREGYYTIHVTPEEGWSYASFECNVPVSTAPSDSSPASMPDLKTLVQRVVDIFRPRKISLTMFLSTSEDLYADYDHVEHAQKAFKSALVDCAGEDAKRTPYRRTDKINYEFMGYDLAFASFEAVQ